MAEYYRQTVVLDACVLYPAPLRDLLLSVAAAGIFRARWTHLIQEEWISNLTANRPDLKPAALQRTAALMNAVIDDCLIENFEHLIASFELPDAEDRHVLAAAVAAQADAIVTFNLRDFPEAATIPHAVEIFHPDDFLAAQSALDPDAFLGAIKGIRDRLRNPPKTADQLIAVYEAQGIPQVCQLLRRSIASI